jgi:S1-C subfamily serine protease
VAIALTGDALALAPGTDAPDGADLWLAEAVVAAAPDPWLEEAFAEKDADLEREPAIDAVPIAAEPPGAVQLGLDIGDLVPGLAAARPAPVTPTPGQHPSVVAVRAGKAAGHGFYVRKDMVLTAYGLVASISVVDVTTADGATVPALVAAVDQARDLAVLQVPRPGPAVTLHDGPQAAPPPGAGLGAGHPLFSGTEVIGMAATDRVIGVDAIRSFLAGQAGVFAAVP